MAAKGTNDPAQGAIGPHSVAIYTRVSTDNQVGGRFDSCESQAAYCREQIERKEPEGWYEVACLTDAAYSGANLERPGMRALKRMVEAGEVKIVLVYKLERVMRSTDEWIPFRAFLKKHGCRLESATEDISENTPSGRLKNMLMMSFNTYERENTSEKTLAKMQQQAKRGIWNGGCVPYGYSYDKNTQTLQQHPHEGPVVKRIFEQAARLVSLTDIANELNAEGLRTKERMLQRRDGKTQTVGARPFRSDGLRLLLKNPIYRGSVKFDGREYNARHEALVSSEIWDKANAATKETKIRPEHLFQARDAQNHLLKGIAWCGSCGRALVPNDSGKKSVRGTKYRYYTCSLVMREATAPGCTVGRMSADALEKAVVTLVGEAGKHPTVVAEMVDVSRRMRGGDRDTLRAELGENQKAVGVVDKHLGNCVDVIARGGADALGDALVARAAHLKTERQRLLLEQERIRQSLAASEATVLDERRITENLDRLGELLPSLSPDERKELMRLFVERVEVRRLQSRRIPTAQGGTGQPGERLMEIRIKLHLAELVRGLEARAGVNRPAVNLRLRGLNLDAKVDFTNAQRGEVTITAPFRQTLRLDARVRVVRPSAPKVEHPILRAQKWHQMLEDGRVLNRFALAKRVEVDPAMVTRTLKLMQLAPEIQEYLATLRTPSALWYFNIKALGKMADFPLEKQRVEFAKLSARFDERSQQLKSPVKTVPLTPSAAPPVRSGPRLAAG